jgi:hypothetical protein
MPLSCIRRVPVQARVESHRVPSLTDTHLTWYIYQVRCMTA